MKDLEEDDPAGLTPVVRERGSVQLSHIQEPVTVRGWPVGLALASAPSITVSMTATGLQKMMSVMASLNLPSRRGGYKVETNQCTQELASIRAQPKVRIPPRQLITRFFLFILAGAESARYCPSGIGEAALSAVAAAVC